MEIAQATHSCGETRRRGKDCEGLADSSEAMIYISMTDLMLQSDRTSRFG